MTDLQSSHSMMSINPNRRKEKKKKRRESVLLIIKLRNTHASIIQFLQVLINIGFSNADSKIIQMRTDLKFICMFSERKIKYVGGRRKGDVKTLVKPAKNESEMTDNA